MPAIPYHKAVMEMLRHGDIYVKVFREQLNAIGKILNGAELLYFETGQNGLDDRNFAHHLLQSHRS